MVIIILVKENNMFDIECFSNTFFLKKLFPNGVHTSILINVITVSAYSYSRLEFYIRQKPEIEVKKWGQWGIDYDCLYIETLTNISPADVKITNIEKIGFNLYDFERNEQGMIEIKSNSKNGSIHFSAEPLAVQTIKPFLWNIVHPLD